ncbi:hypothetical protein [Pseudactinotalea sp. Z1748]|uniref:hypothetical protein n=1 Tax=Pseudactinotalea sp. Z1748 TaxID=3413027 RepID=UPI003C7BCF71
MLAEISAAVLVTAATAGCSVEGGAQDVQPETPQDAAAPHEPTASDRPAPGTGTPSARPTPTPDFPEGYYVVNNGRAAVPERGGAGCDGLPSLEPRSDDTDDRVHGYWYSELRDVNPIDGARGEAIHDEHDQPVAYVAAPGDTMSAIAARFCIDHYPYLEWINAIRRGEGTSITDTGSMPVYAGDTLNLDPYTIATVGDENGVVRDNAIDFHIPPQH